MFGKLKSKHYNIKDKVQNDKFIICEVILTLLVSVAVLLIIRFSLYLGKEISLSKIDAGDWLSFIGSFVGVLGAFLVANYQFRIEKRRVEKEKQAHVFLASEKYNDIRFLPGYDIYNQSKPLRHIDSMSEMTIKIINAGKSTIYNAHVLYEFPNIDNYLDIYDEKSKESEDFKFRKTEESMFIFVENEHSSRRYSMKSNYVSDEIPYLISNQEEQIRVPSFYLYLLQYYLIVLNIESLTEEGRNIKKPVVKATLIYDNYKLEKEEKVFYITHTKHHLRTGRHEASGEITIKPYRQEQFKY